MNLDPLRIVLQGIGYGALFVALQGFAPAEAVEVLPTSGGAGASAPQRVPRAAVWPQQREEEEILIIIAAALQVLEPQ